MSGSISIIVAAAAASFAVTASPPFLYSGSTGGSFSTDSTTAIPAGGSGSYTYAWTTVVSDGTHHCTANAPSSATTNFALSGVGIDETLEAVATCLVTDTITAATASVDVEINHTRFSSGGGGPPP